jgi:non-ribosomal peptide synthetase component F
MVGLSLQNGLEMIVGLLGILKAGGAYVPLEPAWPPERLALILQETRLPIVLTKGTRATTNAGDYPRRGRFIAPTAD